jgi:tRNA pseudouridine13 synthase
MKVHEPERLANDLPPVGGRVGPNPEDFRVDEVLDFVPSGSGEHRFVRIEKRGMNSQDALRVIARAAGVRERDAGSAGMKDKHAITTQWLSLPARSTEPSQWQLPENLRVLEATLHDKKLRTGQQAGNRFVIRMVDVHEQGALRARAVVERLLERGMPNYFGAQRFGYGGQNLARALSWLSEPAERRRRAPRFAQKLNSSVIQSEIFNRYLSARLSLDFSAPLKGEVVRLDGTHTTFVVDDPDSERPRWQTRDIHPTGPMPGPRMRPARDDALALEERVLGELGLAAESLEALSDHAPGTRRDLVAMPEGFELTPGPPGELTLSFFLPSGSYATELLRQLTGTPFLQARSALDPR